MSDLSCFARGILEFAEQSIQQGLDDPSQLLECVTEADNALRILKKRIGSDDPLISSLMLLGVFDSYAELVMNNPRDFGERLARAQEVMRYAKSLLN